MKAYLKQIHTALQHMHTDDDSIGVILLRLTLLLFCKAVGLLPRELTVWSEDIGEEFLTERFLSLFEILNTPIMGRNSECVLPYINTGLFADDDVTEPEYSVELVRVLREAEQGYDWSTISPTEFGVVFEDMLSEVQKREGGMHYTSVENIHRVIDPLFLNNLNAEYEKIMTLKSFKSRRNKLYELQKKIAGLKFLDPTCGSGNFLTEIYLSLRRLENKIISELYGTEMNVLDSMLDVLVKVSTEQVFGIEIDDLAVTTAKTALWIAEVQTRRETAGILNMPLMNVEVSDEIHIIQGNSLLLDWVTVVPPEELNYIVGNPPFLGARVMTKEQKTEINWLFAGVEGCGNFDYVSGWFQKAADYAELNREVEFAFVATKSVVQGVTGACLWRYLRERGIVINFAVRAFKWGSGVANEASVWCVIVGCGYAERKVKWIYTETEQLQAKHINSLLLDMPDMFIENRNKPISDAPKMIVGNAPFDFGFFFVTPEERAKAIAEEPWVEPYIPRVYRASDFIYNKEMYCIWLTGVEYDEAVKSTFLHERISKVRENRLASSRAKTLKDAETPHLFAEIRQPDTNYLMIPATTSGSRKYIPLGYSTPDIICTAGIYLIPEANLYHFGVLISRVHTIWLDTVCCKMKNDYSYTVAGVYNNFPWCECTEAQKQQIAKTGGNILEVRKRYPDKTLAELYNTDTMPADLKEAHWLNDMAVLSAYSLEGNASNEKVIETLMKLYAKITSKEGTV